MSVTAWSVKYWETSGIQRQDDCEDEGEYLSWGSGWHRRFEKIGKDIFLSESEAIDEANKRVARKIKSTEKKLEKLRAMRFTRASA